jgi:hypothetical protein
MAEPKGIEPSTVTDVTEKYDGYWKALGRFIHAFSDAEAIVQMLLWTESAVTVDVARSIFSGARIDTAKGFITRLRESRGVGEHPQLKRAFDQLAVITRARNDIVHYGAKFDGTTFSVSNSLVAHIPERTRSFAVSPEIFEEMIADLGAIRSILGAYQLERMKETPGAILAGDPQDVIDSLYRTGSAPWQYKPTQPIPTE